MYLLGKLFLTECFIIFCLQRDSKERLPSLTTVLKQEVDRFNRLLKVVHTSLADLKKAIKGFIVMSDALEAMYTSFLNQQV